MSAQTATREAAEQVAKKATQQDDTEPTIEIPPVSVLTSEPDAPYGYKEDGTPKKAPGRPRTNGPRRTTTRRQPQTPNYYQGVKGLFQAAAVPLAFTSPFDAYAITKHHDPIAKACHQLALENAAFAALLDRIMVVGPYSMLVSACLPLVAQVAYNHKLIPEELATGLGAISQAQIIAELTGQSQPSQGASNVRDLSA